MATIASSHVQRLYVEGSGSRFAVYRVLWGSTGDTLDLSTGFSVVLKAVAVQPGPTVNLSTVLGGGTSALTSTAMTGTLFVGVIGTAGVP